MTRSARSDELLGLDPRPSSDRDRGALAERHRRRLGRSQLEALLGDVGEQVVGLGRPRRPATREIASSSKAFGRNGLPRASVRTASSASARILATPLRQRMRAQEGQPRVDRGAAVGQGAVVARAFGRVGPALRLRRPAPDRGDERAEHGDRRVPLERPVRLQPVEPALGGRDTAALVGG